METQVAERDSLSGGYAPPARATDEGGSFKDYMITSNIFNQVL